jgi:hypothetical protein
MEQDWPRQSIPPGADHRKLLEEVADSLNVDIPWRSSENA